jgi:LuxR family maltose regulon positive regulatory protein
MSVRRTGAVTASVKADRTASRRLEVARPKLPFDVAEAKIRVPALRPDTVSRTALVNRLRAASDRLAVCIAPAGYGKTTLLAQWAGRDPRPFAWVSVDERDNNPAVLLQSVGAAVDRVEPLKDDVASALHRPGKSVWSHAAPRLASAVAGVAQPFVLVLDEVDLLDGDAIKAVALLIEHIPDGSVIAITGRVVPRLPISRLRARGLVLEIEAADLALSAREIRLVLQHTDVDLAEIDVDVVAHSTEGWSAGVYMTGLAFTQGRDAHSSAAFRGDDRYVAEYFDSEYLSQLTPRQRAFLRRTSVFERLCGGLCDAVLERSGSARELASIQRANLFLVPLDDHGEWYRYHRLFRDFLQRELAEREPGRVRDLHRRAADWFEANGFAEEALNHAYSSGDAERAARILTKIVMPAYHAGRVTEVEGWLERFDDDQLLERCPGVAVHGSRVYALQGRQADAERWLSAAERRLARARNMRGSDLVSGAASVVRAWLCHDGADQMRVDAELALAKLPQNNQWRPSALLLQAVSFVLTGDDHADAALAEVADAATRLGSTEPLVLALAERALLAAESGDYAAAADLAAKAETEVEAHGLETYAANSLRLIASARAKLREGKWQRARSDLDDAERLIPLVTSALPWLAVQTRLELARVYLAMRDAGQARTRLAEALSIVAADPGLDFLRRTCASLMSDLQGVEASSHGTSGLTDAELRLLPLLATHLSFREIGEKLFVSRNTIKTQAISVYRKLGVSSRSEAIDQATALGLVPGSALPPPARDEALA